MPVYHSYFIQYFQYSSVTDQRSEPYDEARNATSVCEINGQTSWKNQHFRFILNKFRESSRGKANTGCEHKNRRDCGEGRHAAAACVFRRGQVGRGKTMLATGQSHR